MALSITETQHTNVLEQYAECHYAEFHIDATFEMRTNEYVEICISIDAKIIGERVFMWNGKKGKESKVAERQKESERVCGWVDRNQW